MQFLSVSDAARELGVRPRDISDAFYDRALDDTACPIIGRRRLIPRDYLPTVRQALQQRGCIPDRDQGDDVAKPGSPSGGEGVVPG